MALFNKQMTSPNATLAEDTANKALHSFFILCENRFDIFLIQKFQKFKNFYTLFRSLLIKRSPFPSDTFQREFAFQN